MQYFTRKSGACLSPKRRRVPEAMGVGTWGRTGCALQPPVEVPCAWRGGWWVLVSLLAVALVLQWCCR